MASARYFLFRSQVHQTGRRILDRYDEHKRIPGNVSRWLACILGCGVHGVSMRPVPTDDGHLRAGLPSKAAVCPGIMTLRLAVFPGHAFALTLS